MALVPPAPESVRHCVVYQRVLKHDLLSAHVDIVAAAAGPMLDLVVAGPFQLYTLHNRDHAKKLVHLAETIISPATLNRLSPLECALIVDAAYLHDLGMSLTSVERKRVIQSSDFQDHLRDSLDLWHRLQTVRSKLDDAPESHRQLLEFEVFQLQEVALSSFLRARHATRARYREIFDGFKKLTGQRELFSYRGVSFEDVLVDICESHNLDVGTLAEVRGPYDSRFPRDLIIADQRVNVQFCASVLRLTDILDFDRERTPQVLFDSLGIQDNDLPGAETTLSEWQKHMAVHGTDISEHELIFAGDSHHPAIEAAINEFAALIERELRDTLYILRNNKPDIVRDYDLVVPTTVRTRIRSVGYVFCDLRFRLNRSSITNLLMGEHLYAHPGAAVRELIQNAIDACAVRQRVSRDAYKPFISVSLSDADDELWLEIEDNGIGMDERVISEYLFQIGNSYYDSPEFNRFLSAASDSPFHAVSRFGIGIASVFMIGDLLEVTTCNRSSVRGDTKQRFIRVDGRGGLAYVQEHDEGSQGTKIRVRLSGRFKERQAIAHLDSYVRDVVVRPQFQVALKLTEPATLGASNYMGLSDEALRIASEKRVEFVVLELGKFCDSIEGVVVIPFSIAGAKLDMPSRAFLIDENRGFNPYSILEGYRGNRLTVNGFRMGVRKAHRVFGRRLRFAYDINVIGDKEVVFDVARDRIVGTGVSIVRQRLRDAVVLGLHETGVFARLTDSMQKLMTSGLILHGDDALNIDEGLLRSVEKAVPTGTWPIGMHMNIAKQLGISTKDARAAISILLETGRIHDGRYREDRDRP
ncbi:MAG: ATP-binding protein [Planctomycetota bacterium]|nr:ATP-binding protein [Planctomycetota bacterium]